MRRSSKVSGFIAFAAITALSAPPLPAGMNGGMTTVDLTMQPARAAGISLSANDSPQAALESLGKAGINLGSDLKAPVTEKVLVEASLAVGVRASTSRPEAAVTSAVSTAFIQIFKGVLRSAAAVPGQSGTEIVHASCQGRASREARQGTPASPSDFNSTAGPSREPAS